MDGFVEQYRCVTELYLLSVLTHAYNIIIDLGVGAPVHGREFVGGFNDTDKQFLSMLIITVQLSVTAAYDSQMEIHTSTASGG